LSEFYNTIKQKSADTNKANSIIKKLARILIPLNYARNPRFTHDPALPIPQIPVLSLCEEFNEIPEKDHGFVKNQLVRAQNRVVDALDQASVLLE